MRVFRKDKVIYHFSPENEAVYQVKDGEIFMVETDDCYSGQIKNEQTLRPDIDISIMDAAVGPIAIEGAEQGDTLCVDIIDIMFEKQGVMVTSVGLGVLGHKIKKASTKIIPIKNGYAEFSDSIRIPLTPMIGVLGVSPLNEKIHCAVPGQHGGNLDTKEIKPGSKVYLPVFIKGANLAVSDLHACMGDGELSGTGVETPGKVTLKTTVIKNHQIEGPVIETNNEVFVLATDKTFDAAMREAVDRAVEIIKQKNNLDFPDAYRLLSATCDIAISQVVNGVITAKVKIPKYVIRWESFL